MVQPTYAMVFLFAEDPAHYRQQPCEGPMVPRFVSTNPKGEAMKTRKFQGPILGPPDRIIIRLGHVRRNRPRGNYKGGSIK